MPGQPQFIADQRLYRLNLDPKSQQDKLQHLRLHKLPDPGNKASRESMSLKLRKLQLGGDLQGDRSVERFSADNCWTPIPDRFTYLGSATNRLLAITVSAGIGKSCALEQLMLARENQNDGHLVIWLHFSEIKNSWKKLFDPDAEEKSGKMVLIQKTRAILERAKGLPNANKPQNAELFSWIQYLLRTGNLTLAIDGLDEVSVSDGKKKAKALRSFLDIFDSCRCAIASRPYAITETYWSRLFASDLTQKHDESSQWEFCLVGTFASDQIERFLGSEVFNQIKLLQAEIEWVPRTLEVVRRRSLEELNRLKSAADVYWFSIVKSMELDREGPDRESLTELSSEQVLDLFSACAITMVMWNHDPIFDENTAGQSPVIRIESNQIQKFKRRVFQRLKMLCSSEWETEDSKFFTVAEGKFNELQRLNSSYIDFEFFHANEETGTIQWRNNTDRDFFAALWMVRSSQPQEQEWFGLRQSSVVNFASQSSFEELNELWKLVCGLPDESMLDRDDGQGPIGRWRSIVESLFLRPDSRKSSARARPTEMMYRCWPNLLRRSEWDLGLTASWTEDELQNASTDVQIRVRQEFYVGKTERDFVDSPINQILFRFLSELLRFRKKTSIWRRWYKRIVCKLRQFLELNRVVGDFSAVIEEDLDSQFVRIPYPEDGGFQNGEMKGKYIGKRPESFELCRYPLTERLYSVFDAFHYTREFNSDGYAWYDQPMTGLTWYDGMMSSIYFHGRLPSVFEWEHACSFGGRQNDDGSNAVWYFGNDENELQHHAHYEKNYDLDVDMRDKNWKPNRAGLYHMLGSVWEWCSNRYIRESNDRIMKGGSYETNASFTRCSTFAHGAPSGGNIGFIGVRIARTDEASFRNANFIEIDDGLSQ